VKSVAVISVVATLLVVSEFDQLAMWLILVVLDVIASWLWMRRVFGVFVVLALSFPGILTWIFVSRLAGMLLMIGLAIVAVCVGIGSKRLTRRV
jgi:hypothetical protein